MQKIRAFTLIELLVALSVIAILAAISTPSFMAMIRNNRVGTQANDLLSSLQLARSEAAKRGVQVTLLRSGNSDNVWENGWTVFTDWDGDGVYDDDGSAPECDIEEDCLLRTHDAITHLTIRTDDVYDEWFAYWPDGTPTASGNKDGVGTFRICGSDGDVDSSRSVNISATGRPKVEDEASECP